MSAHPNFDGCYLECTRQNEHTKVYGHCEKGVKPEATTSMSVIVTEEDGTSFIAFDTYTVEGLADLIEPALRSVRIELGPNSLAAIEHGNVLTLTSGEIRSMALEAAHAIVHRNDPQEMIGDAPDRAEEIARCFHEAYEELAPSHGYETREASRKPWSEVPDDNKGLMIAVVARLLEREVIR